MHGPKDPRRIEGKDSANSIKRKEGVQYRVAYQSAKQVCIVQCRRIPITKPSWCQKGECIEGQLVIQHQALNDGQATV